MLSDLSEENKQYLYLFLGAILCLVLITYFKNNLVFTCQNREGFAADEANDNNESAQNVQDAQDAQDIQEIASNIENTIQKTQKTIQENKIKETNLDPLIIMQDLYNNLKGASEDIKKRRTAMAIEISKLEQLSTIVQKSGQSSDELTEHLAKLDEMKGVVEYLKTNKDTITETIQKVEEVKKTMEDSSESSEVIKTKLNELTKLSKTVTDQVNALASSEVANLKIGSKLEVGGVIIDAQGNITGKNLAFDTTGKFMSTVKNGAASGGVEFNHTNRTQGIGIGYNTLYASGTHASQNIGLRPKGNGVVHLQGSTHVDGNLNAKASMNVEGPITFKNIKHNTDPYKLEKLHTSSNKSELRFTLGDDDLPHNNEKMTIYGRTGKKHEFNTLGDASHSGSLKIGKNLQVNDKITFGGDVNANDPYTLEKLTHGSDKSSLRLTINDNSDEKFEIWGNSCGSPGGCGGPGTLKHKFTAVGDAVHERNLHVKGNTTLKSSVNGQGTHLPFTDGKNYISGPTEMRGGMFTATGGFTSTGNTRFTNRVDFKGGTSEHNPNGAFTHFPYSNGRNYIRGDTDLTGNLNSAGKIAMKGGISTHNPNNHKTVFGYSDGKNYIRGDTILHGNLNTPGDLTTTGKLCMGNTCVTPSQFAKMVARYAFNQGLIRRVFSFSGTTIEARVDLVNSDNNAGMESINIQNEPINYDFGSEATFDELTDHVYVRWEGFIRLPNHYNRSVKFAAIGDDGVRILFAGRGFNDNGNTAAWSNHGATVFVTSPVTISGEDNHTIKFEWYEGGGGANVKLLWNIDDNGSVSTITGNMSTDHATMIRQGWHFVQPKFCSHSPDRLEELKELPVRQARESGDQNDQDDQTN